MKDRHILRLLHKYREIIAYGIVGCISTGTSILWFWFFLEPVGLPYLLANAVGWFADCWTDFAMNKYLVFRTTGGFWNEAWKFFSARGVSGLLDMAIMLICVDIFKFSIMASKGIDIVIIIIFNYVAAKFLIFRKG